MALDVLTFGCRLNALESEAMRRAATGSRPQRCRPRQHLRRHRRGRAPGAPGRPPRASREPRAPHRRRRLRRADRPGRLRRHAGGDAGAGQRRKARRCLLRLADGSPRVRVDDIFSIRETAGPLATAVAGHTRAFVEIQNGCDHRCTFCVIPVSAAGNSRSVPMTMVIDTVRTLVAEGRAEVVLTGVDITA